MRDDGEPMGRGQFDRRAAEARALRESVMAAALFGAAILFALILAVVFIELMQIAGIWALSAPEPTTVSADSGSLIRVQPSRKTAACV